VDSEGVRLAEEGENIPKAEKQDAI